MSTTKKLMIGLIAIILSLTIVGTAFILAFGIVKYSFTLETNGLTLAEAGDMQKENASTYTGTFTTNDYECISNLFKAESYDDNYMYVFTTNKETGIGVEYEGEVYTSAKSLVNAITNDESKGANIQLSLKFRTKNITISSATYKDAYADEIEGEVKLDGDSVGEVTLGYYSSAVYSETQDLTNVSFKDNIYAGAFTVDGTATKLKYIEIGDLLIYSYSTSNEYSLYATIKYLKELKDSDATKDYIAVDDTSITIRGVVIQFTYVG